MSGDEPSSKAAEEIDVIKRLQEGRQAFLGIELLCGTGALVPRPETEILARAAIERLKTLGRAPIVIDMCCGVGNIACAIAVHVPGSRVYASDLTDGAVEWARRNVAQLGLQDRVEIAQGDLFGGLENRGLAGTIDAVVCNPPYISTNRLMTDRSTLLENEPREAFDAGPYGLNIHQRVVREAPPYLAPRGWLLVEVGLRQERQVKILFDRTGAYDTTETANDEADRPRVVIGRLRAQQ